MSLVGGNLFGARKKKKILGCHSFYGKGADAFLSI